ncbi:hypothetical protein LY76DRAFT_182622 [Colletotrichum caudatum]|nr:hypothetical protein LY76DRAFT_182622 [Colletotrichum caudatum]
MLAGANQREGDKKLLRVEGCVKARALTRCGIWGERERERERERCIRFVTVDVSCSSSCLTCPSQEDASIFRSGGPGGVSHYLLRGHCRCQSSGAGYFLHCPLRLGQYLCFSLLPLSAYLLCPENPRVSCSSSSSNGSSEIYLSKRPLSQMRLYISPFSVFPSFFRHRKLSRAPRQPP